MEAVIPGVVLITPVYVSSVKNRVLLPDMMVKQEEMDSIGQH